jgi:hypothetical protein
MTQWLDTQTKAILQGKDPPRIAPPLEAGFSLILLERGQNSELFQRAISRILEPEKNKTMHDISNKPCPIAIQSLISYENASLGQFELICADSISVILRDDVAMDGESDYLESLYQSLRRSQEFQIVLASLLTVPVGDRGQNFCDQFLGCTKVLPPITISTTFKKARIMQHWAGQIGAEFELASK